MKFLSFLLLPITAVMLVSCGENKKSEYPEGKEGSLNWIDMKTAATLSNTEKKMYFVDVYTDWCGWCKVMDKKTFTDPQVIKALSEKYHVVKFDAEQKDAIVFNGQTFEWQAAGRNGVNMLAYALLQGQLSYPSYVFLDADRKPFKIARGFMPADQFLQELASVGK
jgi:thiol:disulfide interchange protein